MSYDLVKNLSFDVKNFKRKLSYSPSNLTDASGRALNLTATNEYETKEEFEKGVVGTFQEILGGGFRANSANQYKWAGRTLELEEMLLRDFPDFIDDFINEKGREKLEANHNAKFAEKSAEEKKQILRKEELYWALSSLQEQPEHPAFQKIVSHFLENVPRKNAKEYVLSSGYDYVYKLGINSYRTVSDGYRHQAQRMNYYQAKVAEEKWASHGYTLMPIHQSVMNFQEMNLLTMENVTDGLDKATLQAEARYDIEQDNYSLDVYYYNSIVGEERVQVLEKLELGNKEEFFATLDDRTHLKELVLNKILEKQQSSEKIVEQQFEQVFSKMLLKFEDERQKVEIEQKKERAEKLLDPSHYLQFSTKREYSPVEKRNYHQITDEELSLLNDNASMIQEQAKIYDEEFAGTKVHYLYNGNDKLNSLSIDFSKGNFPHLLGMFVSQNNWSNEKTFESILSGEGEFNDILVSKFLEEKLAVLPEFENLLDVQSTILNDFSKIPVNEQPVFDEGLLSPSEKLLLGIIHAENGNRPNSLQNFTLPYMKEKYEEVPPENELLAIVRERGESLEFMSFKEQYLDMYDIENITAMLIDSQKYTENNLERKEIDMDEKIAQEKRLLQVQSEFELSKLRHSSALEVQENVFAHDFEETFANLSRKYAAMEMVQQKLMNWSQALNENSSQEELALLETLSKNTQPLNDLYLRQEEVGNLDFVVLSKQLTDETQSVTVEEDVPKEKLSLEEVVEIMVEKNGIDDNEGFYYEYEPNANDYDYGDIAYYDLDERHTLSFYHEADYNGRGYEDKAIRLLSRLDEKDFGVPFNEIKGEYNVATLGEDNLFETFPYIGEIIDEAKEAIQKENERFASKQAEQRSTEEEIQPSKQREFDFEKIAQEVFDLRANGEVEFGKPWDWFRKENGEFDYDKAFDCFVDDVWERKYFYAPSKDGEEKFAAFKQGYDEFFYKDGQDPYLLPVNENGSISVEYTSEVANLFTKMFDNHVATHTTLPEKYLRVEFNETANGVESLQGKIVTPEMIQTIQGLDVRFSPQGTGYLKFYFDEYENGEVVNHVRMDVGDGLEVNASEYEWLNRYALSEGVVIAYDTQLFEKEQAVKREKELEAQRFQEENETRFLNLPREAQNEVLLTARENPVNLRYALEKHGFDESVQQKWAYSDFFESQGNERREELRDSVQALVREREEWLAEPHLTREMFITESLKETQREVVFDRNLNAALEVATNPYNFRHDEVIQGFAIGYDVKEDNTVTLFLDDLMVSTTAKELLNDLKEEKNPYFDMYSEYLSAKQQEQEKSLETTVLGNEVPLTEVEADRLFNDEMVQEAVRSDVIRNENQTDNSRLAQAKRKLARMEDEFVNAKGPLDGQPFGQPIVMNERGKRIARQLEKHQERMFNKLHKMQAQEARVEKLEEQALRKEQGLNKRGNGLELSVENIPRIQEEIEKASRGESYYTSDTIKKYQEELVNLENIAKQSEKAQSVMSERTKQLIESGQVTQWAKKPTFYFVKGLKKVALNIDEKTGDFVVSPQYPTKTEEEREKVANLLSSVEISTPKEVETKPILTEGLSGFVQQVSQEKEVDTIQEAIAQFQPKKEESVMPTEVASVVPKNHEVKLDEDVLKDGSKLTHQALELIKGYTANPEELKEYLNFMSKFPTLSPRNTALIQEQWHGANAVATFNQWSKLGTELGLTKDDFVQEKGQEKGNEFLHVRRGEKAAITLLRPNTSRYLVVQGADGKPTNKLEQHWSAEEKSRVANNPKLAKQVVVNFSPYKVFELSQTNLKPESMPKLMPNRQYDFEVDKEKVAQVNAGINEYARKINVPIETDYHQQLGNAKGAYFPDEQVIRLNPLNTDGEKIATSIHELAHATLHNPAMDKQGQGMGKEQKELEAEMTSYIVSKHFGLDTSEKAIPYMASWTKNLTKLSDGALSQSMNRVQHVAKSLITTIGGKVDALAKEMVQGNSVSNEQMQGKVKGVGR